MELKFWVLDRGSWDLGSMDAQGSSEYNLELKIDLNQLILKWFDSRYFNYNIIVVKDYLS